MYLLQHRACWDDPEEKKKTAGGGQKFKAFRISSNKFSIILWCVSSEIPLHTQGSLSEHIISWYAEMYFAIAQPTLMYLLFIWY